jgi:hypothetical protein
VVAVSLRQSEPPWSLCRYDKVCRHGRCVATTKCVDMVAVSLRQSVPPWSLLRQNVSLRQSVSTWSFHFVACDKVCCNRHLVYKYSLNSSFWGRLYCCHPYVRETSQIVSGLIFTNLHRHKHKR